MSMFVVPSSTTKSPQTSAPPEIKKNRTQSKFVLALFLFFCFLPGLSNGFEGLVAGDIAHESLLAHALRQQFEANHFSRRKIDDSLSKAAFSLYLKQLDPQKVFLLSADVEKLRAFASAIDDEINSGKMELPLAGMNILKERITRVQPKLSELMAEDFDFSGEEFTETDPEKLDYCRTEEELKERWRKMLKLQVLNRYLSLKEDEEAPAESDSGKEKAAPRDMQKTAREKVLKSYDDVLSRMLKEQDREHFERYFNSLARALDPHTEYMPPMDKEDFEIGMKGSLEGIGALLREEDGYVKVESVMPGGPADRQGQLDAGDRILKVAQGDGEPADIVGMKVRDAVRLIRGKKGTEARLTVKKHDGAQMVISIVRDVVQIEETFAKGTVLSDEKTDKTFGYIKLPSFYRDFESSRKGAKGRNSTDDVRAEIRKLGDRKIEGLILDLRNNGGGALTDAVGIAGLFLRTGPVVQVKGGRGDVRVLFDEDPEVSYRGPLVVLVNKFSASASEILSGALQDHGRAIIIGSDHTYGKGTVQAVVDLNDTFRMEGTEKLPPLGALRVTIQKFYRTTGESTQYRGVVPDIVLPDRMDGVKSGEEFLEYALPWDKMTPVPYEKWEAVLPDPSVLREKSKERIKGREDFVDIEKESKRVSERQKNTMQSLKIDVVQKEREEARQTKEKMNKKSHGSSDHEKKRSTEPKMTGEERKKVWSKEVAQDPYVQEATAVLKDLISLPRRENSKEDEVAKKPN